MLFAVEGYRLHQDAQTTSALYQGRLIHALCTAAGFAPHTVHHADDWQAVLAIVRHGLGVCLVPRLVSHDAHPALRECAGQIVTAR